MPPDALDIRATLVKALELRDQGRPAEAAALCAQVIAAAPRHEGARYLDGLLALDMGRLGEAEAALRVAVTLAPGLTPAHLNLGLLLRRLGRPAEAIASYDRVLEREPRHAEALNCRGVALLDLKRRDEALADFDAAIAANPGLAAAHSNRGLALVELERPADALQSLSQALAIAPGDARAHFNRGNALLALGRPDEAIVSYDAALAVEPNDAEGWANRGVALLAVARPEDALASSERAIAQRPDDPMLWFGRANALATLGRRQEAVDIFDRVAAARPDFRQATYNSGRERLALGQFRRGWEDYAARWETPEFLRGSAGPAARAALERFDATIDINALAQRNVLAVTEQGIGDAIMFASMLPDLAAVAGRVTLATEPRLVALFCHSFPGVEVRSLHDVDITSADFDAVIPIGDLGRLFRNVTAEFPGAPYLSASPEARSRWAARLGAGDGRPRVGVSWRGGMAQTRQRERSLSLSMLRPLLDVPDCIFVSLQYGDVAAELGAENAGRDTPVQGFPSGDVNDFDDLAALVQSLDMVVSVQTAVVHLAGAVGTPCLVMTPAEPEWRYAAAAPDMAWYRSVKIARQARAGDWSAPLEAAVGLAAEKAAERGAG